VFQLLYRKSSTHHLYTFDIFCTVCEKGDDYIFGWTLPTAVCFQYFFSGDLAVLMTKPWDHFTRATLYASATLPVALCRLGCNTARSMWWPSAVANKLSYWLLCSLVIKYFCSSYFAPPSPAAPVATALCRLPRPHLRHCQCWRVMGQMGQHIWVDNMGTCDPLTHNTLTND